MPQFDLFYYLDDVIFFIVFLFISIIFWHFFLVLDLLAFKKVRTKSNVLLSTFYSSLIGFNLFNSNVSNVFNKIKF